MLVCSYIDGTINENELMQTAAFKLIERAITDLAFRPANHKPSLGLPNPPHLWLLFILYQRILLIFFSNLNFKKTKKGQIEKIKIKLYYCERM